MTIPELERSPVSEAADLYLRFHAHIKTHTHTLSLFHFHLRPKYTVSHRFLPKKQQQSLARFEPRTSQPTEKRMFIFPKPQVCRRASERRPLGLRLSSLDRLYRGFDCGESVPLHYRGSVVVLERRRYWISFYSFAAGVCTCRWIGINNCTIAQLIRDKIKRDKVNSEKT